MRTLADLLREGLTLAPDDLAQITAQAAGLLRYGHDLGAIHGDVAPETLLVDRQGNGWVVQLDQPRSTAGATGEPAADVRDLGRVVERLAQGIASADLPASFDSAVQSMTSSDPSQRPTAGQVELYFGEDFLDGAAPQRDADPDTGTAAAGTTAGLPAQGDPGDADPDDDDTQVIQASGASWGAEEATMAIPLASADAWEPSGRGASDIAYSDQAHAPEAAAYSSDPADLFAPGDDPDADDTNNRPARSGRAAVVVSAVVLLLGVGSLSYVAWQALGPEPGEAASLSDAGPSGDEESDDADGAALDGDTTEATDDDAAAAEGDADPAEDGASDETSTDASSTDAPVEDDGSTPATGSTSDEDGDGDGDGSSVAGSAGDTGEDHTDPQWAAEGWDTQALSDAYCRDGSEFVGLADTKTYRGVVCNSGWGYVYRGLNKAANATLLSTADATADGWEAHGEGGVVYRFDEDTFTIVDGDADVLDEETVELWLTPEQDPFLPGDLDLSQPISYPDCDGSGVVVISSHMDPSTDAETVQEALDDNPGSFYVRTDLSCDNFNRPSETSSSNGNYIYAVLAYGGDTRSGLCSSISAYDTYGYFLREGVPPGQLVECD